MRNRANAKVDVSAGPYYLYGYSLPLDASKVVKSVTPPDNPHVVTLAVALADPAGTDRHVGLTSAYNLIAVFPEDQVTKSQGIDGHGNAYSNTDGSAQVVLVSLSDWRTPQAFAGENIASTMPYRIDGSGNN